LPRAGRSSRPGSSSVLQTDRPGRKAASLGVSPTEAAADLLGDGGELHVAGALVDFADLGISVELLHRVLADETDAAEQVDGRGGGALRDLGGEQLGHGRLRQEVRARVLEARGVVDQKARGLDVRRHAGELKLYALKLREP